VNFSCGYDQNSRESPSTVFHPWLQQELTAIVTALPPLDELPDAAENRTAWVRWQEGLSVRFTLLDALPRLRLLLIIDNISLWTTSRAIRVHRWWAG
jgi:hypothetical protein